MKKIILNPYLILACRPRQWTKNLLVFTAPTFSFQLNWDLWASSIVSFIMFCLLSSSVYLVNDTLDIKLDKLHPTKRKRPIASGMVSIEEALICAISFVIFAIFIGLLLSVKLVIVGILYLLMQLSYCIWFKRKPIIDIFCISAGFLLRAISGAFASSLYISPWFLLSLGLLALFLSIEKRKSELEVSIQKNIITREVLKSYSMSLLKRYENIVSTGAFFSYALWAAGPALNGAPTQWMLITVPLVLIGIFRYQFISDKDSINSKENLISTENPEDILLKDKGIKLIIITWLISIFLIGMFVF